MNLFINFIRMLRLKFPKIFEHAEATETLIREHLLLATSNVGTTKAGNAVCVYKYVYSQ